MQYKIVKLQLLCVELFVGNGCCRFRNDCRLLLDFATVNKLLICQQLNK